MASSGGPVTTILLLLFVGCDAGKDDTSSGTCATENEDCAPGVSGCGGEGSNMLPGSDCLSCHTGEEDDDRKMVPEEETGSLFTAGGTLFLDLDGSDYVADAIVRITDAEGTVVELTTSSKGNFYTNDALVMPISAEVETADGVLSMGTTVATGACNTCHTCEGEAGGKLHAM